MFRNAKSPERFLPGSVPSTTARKIGTGEISGNFHLDAEFVGDVFERNFEFFATQNRAFFSETSEHLHLVLRDFFTFPGKLIRDVCGIDDIELFGVSDL